MKLLAYFSAFKNSLVLLLLCQLHSSTGDTGGSDTLPGIFLSRTPKSPFGFLLFTYEKLLDTSAIQVLCSLRISVTTEI